MKLTPERKQYYIELTKYIKDDFLGRIFDIETTAKELHSEILETYPAYTSKYGTIKGLYLPEPEDLLIYELYARFQKRYCECYTQVDNVSQDQFRGPDWYFFKGYPGDRDGPGDWWFETLTEQKEKFQERVSLMEQLKEEFIKEHELERDQADN